MVVQLCSSLRHSSSGPDRTALLELVRFLFTAIATAAVVAISANSNLCTKASPFLR